MAPLEVQDWGAFRSQLTIAKYIGITSISTDVWWGKVEGAGDEQFNWSYYDKVSQTIIDSGLKWMPILSFHQCGGNVGDDCNIPIPSWVWKKLGHMPPEQHKYKSEKGNYSNEVISLWSNDKASRQYIEFVTAFRSRYSMLSEHIEEINISTGPSGELRYPSYNTHDHFTYPERGFFQAYSDDAITDFVGYTRNKYVTLEKVNDAWETNLQDWLEIRPPTKPEEFFTQKEYLNTQYGKDFTYWYSQSLLKHGAFMLQLVTNTLGSDFSGIPLGIKIPGIHWQMSSPTMPRSAEITAGLISTDNDIFSETTGYGYFRIIEMIKHANTEHRPVVLHFTCLEMDNNPSTPNYSQAKNLVFWVDQAAKSQNIEIMGENALSSGVKNERGWDNIDNAIRWGSYRGLTTLRLGDLAVDNNLGFKRYQRLIEDFKPQ